MLKRSFSAAALAGTAVLATSAMAQPISPMPTPEVLANADKYDPPKLTDYAAKLASQPDMTGPWQAVWPPGSGAGPTFDPLNTFWPSKPIPGESFFGPLPGTYIKGIPYNPEYQAKYDLYVKEGLEGKSRDPFAACRPYGVPRMIGDSPVPFDIIQSPEVMFWYNDYGRSERRIFLDGRKHPAATQVTPTGGGGASFSGHSVGHWEGNTLVVDTVDILPGNYDETSAPYSDKLHMVERMRLVEPNVLEIQMTFDDPVAFTKPWVVTRYFRRGGSANAPSRAFINLNDRPCVPNVGIDEEGYQVLLLPQEVEAKAAAGAKSKGKKKGK